MKIIKLGIVTLLAISLLLCNTSCSEHTVPSFSVENNEQLSSKNPLECDTSLGFSKKELMIIQKRVYEYLQSKRTLTVSLKSFEENWNTEYWGAMAHSIKCYAADVENTNYPDCSVTEKLSKGLFHTEVYALLGAPLYSMDTQAAVAPRLETDVITIYLLSNGQLLLLRFSPLLIENYTQQELYERIPFFEEKFYHFYSMDAFYFSRIGELQSYELLSEADLYKMDFQYDYFPSTIIENSYFSSCLTVKNFEKVEKGMTEKEVNGLLGSPFYSYQTEPGMLVTWYAAYLVFGENYSFAPWQITFEKNMTGEYVVTSIENDLAMLLDGLFEVP